MTLHMKQQTIATYNKNKNKAEIIHPLAHSLSATDIRAVLPVQG